MRHPKDPGSDAHAGVGAASRPDIIATVGELTAALGAYPPETAVRLALHRDTRRPWPSAPCCVPPTTRRTLAATRPPTSASCGSAKQFRTAISP